MNKASFARIRTRIQAGDLTAFESLIELCGEKCVNSLVKNTGCTEEEAEAILIEALFSFREKIFRGKISYISNFSKYLYASCWTIWRDRVRDKGRPIGLAGMHKRAFFDVSQSENDPLKWKEIEQESEIRYQQQLDATYKSLSLLDEDARKLLTLYYINKRGLQEIATIMGYNGPGDVKTAKARYFQLWLKEIEVHMEREKWITNRNSSKL